MHTYKQGDLVWVTIHRQLSPKIWRYAEEHKITFTPGVIVSSMVGGSTLEFLLVRFLDLTIAERAEGHAPGVNSVDTANLRLRIN